MLAKEPTHGYQLRSRLSKALGSLADELNAGQIYVQLGRLEKGGFIARHETSKSSDGSDRKIYELTASGQERVTEWLSEVAWSKPDLVEFHLKLITAAAAGLADPISIIDRQRRELLRHLRNVQRAAMSEPNGSDPGLILEGIALRLQADLRWLEACEVAWTERRGTK